MHNPSSNMDTQLHRPTQRCEHVHLTRHSNDTVWRHLTHHDQVDEAVQQHTTLLCSRKVHHREEEAKRGRVVIGVQEVKATALPNQHPGVNPLPDL